MVKVWTSPRSFYWATLIEGWDSELLVVRCVSHDHVHYVRREAVNG